MSAPREIEEQRGPEADAFEAREDDAAPEDDAVDRVLGNVALERRASVDAAAAADAEPSRHSAVKSARGTRMQTATITVHGGRGTGLPASYVATVRGGFEIEVELDDGVDPALVARAADSGERVLLEEDPDVGAVVVGVLQTRLPETLELRARNIVIDAENEVTIRSGKAGMRLREDGDVELVGSRIVTMSRGLFRLVGRMLRLN